MIFGQHFEFIIYFDVVERSDDGRWKFGIFNFVINEEIFPAKGSNYTLPIAINFLKDSVAEIELTNKIDTGDLKNDIDILRYLSHSHNCVLSSDPDDLELPDIQPIGVDLTPLEIADTGFYLFYYIEDDVNEYLVFTSDYGATAKKKKLPRGTVKKIINALPDSESI